MPNETQQSENEGPLARMPSSDDPLSAYLRDQEESRKAICQTRMDPDEKVNRMWALHHGDPYGA